MNNIMKVSLLVAVALLSGCASMPKLAGMGLDGAKLAKPEYAAVIDQIKWVVASEKPNPVEGFEYSIIYRVDGIVTEKERITWEEVFRRTGGIGEQDVSGPRTPIDEGAKPNEELRAQIEAILTAAGVE